MIEYLNSILSEHLAYAISWTVIHSLWQASLIALIMSWFLNRYKNEDAIIRYRIAYAALIFVFLGAILTFTVYYGFDLQNANTLVLLNYTIGSTTPVETEAGSVISHLGAWLSHNVELLASMWVLGVMLFFVKLSGSYLFASQLKRKNADFISDSVYKELVELKNKLGIQRYVHLAESAKINTPMLIGFFKPVILFPIGLINHLSIEETQAILAHELAHIKRNDFFHNLILSVIEMLFYYHPAVWWISANVRMERENCCDDVAMKLIGNKSIYAKTLLKIEELKTTKIPSVAIPLSRNKNQLLHRISRIVNQPQTKNQIRERLVATCLLFSFFFGFGSTAMDQNFNTLTDAEALDNRIVTNIVKDCDKQVSHAVLKMKNQKGDCNCDNTTKSLVNVSVSNTAGRDIIYIDTIPSRKKTKMTIINSGDDQEVILKMKDGKIVELTVDGEDIEEDDYEKHLSQDVGIDKMIEDAQEQAELLTEKFNKRHSELIENHVKLNQYSDDLIAKINLGLLDKKNDFYESNGQKRNLYQHKYHKEFGEELEKLSNSDFPHREFENQLGLFDSLRFNMPNIDSIFDNTIRNGIASSDFEFEMPHFEKFGNALDKPVDKLWDALSKDGFINLNKKNTIEITGKYLKINGKKQPSYIFKKYKKLFEDAVGYNISKNSRFKFEYDKQDGQR